MTELMMSNETATIQTPRRALHVYGSLSRGGAETWLMDVMRNSSRRMLQLDVCLTKDVVGPYEEEFKELGGRILRCPLRKGPVQFAGQLMNLLKSERYDIVHSHLYYFSGVVLRCAALSNVPQRVAHIHPVIDARKKSFVRRLYTYWMHRWICRYGTHFVGPTRASLEGFWGRDWESDSARSVLYNGVKTERFKDDVNTEAVLRELDLPPQAKIILNVGRYAPHKRQSFLVDVAERLCRKRDDVYFLFIGDGDLRTDVEAKAEQASVKDRCRFVPGAPSIDQYYLTADTFAFPSSNEGFGIAVAEAGAAGLPVVAQDIPGVDEAADSCRHITLLPLDASPDTWVNHLEQYIEIGRMDGESRRDHLKDYPFSLESSIASLYSLYGLDPNDARAF